MEVPNECLKFLTVDQHHHHHNPPPPPPHHHHHHHHHKMPKNDTFINLLSIISPSENITEIMKLWSDNLSEWLYLALCIIIFCIVIYFVWWFNFSPLELIRDSSDFGFNHLSEFKSKRNNKKELINRERRLRKIGAKIPPPFPNGWFGVAESKDVMLRKAITKSCLGQTFAIFRSEKGQVHILDAYCPHLGANLGVGGIVRGDCIECPFHQWSFSGTDGQCVNVPYSSQGVAPKQAKVKKWISFEFGGTIFVWYHVDNIEPWSIPRVEEIDSGHWIYHGRNEFLINCHIQEIPENGADAAHLPAVHGPSILTGSDLRYSRKAWASFGMHSWQAAWQPVTEKGLNHVATVSLTHSYRLFNKLEIGTINVFVKQIGPSYVQLFLTSSMGPMVILQTVTPVEAMVQKVIHKFYGPRNLYMFAKLLVWGETVQFERDIMVWNSKQYIDSPCLVKEDKQIKAYRNWYRQFYSENSISYTNAKGGLDW